MKKPRADARLKTLPEERQAIIADFARGHSLEETAAWLRGDGIDTSASAVSQWLSWYSLREQLKRNESTVETVLADLKRSNPAMTERELFAAGQAFFSALAIGQQDAEAWNYAQNLRLKQSALELEREKFEVATCKAFLKWHADTRAREVVEGKATNAEKIEQLRQIMFADLEGAK